MKQAAIIATEVEAIIIMLRALSIDFPAFLSVLYFCIEKYSIAEPDNSIIQLNLNGSFITKNIPKAENNPVN